VPTTCVNRCWGLRIIPYRASRAIRTALLRLRLNFVKKLHTHNTFAYITVEGHARIMRLGFLTLSYHGFLLQQHPVCFPMPMTGHAPTQTCLPRPGRRCLRLRSLSKPRDDLCRHCVLYYWRMGRRAGHRPLPQRCHCPSARAPGEKLAFKFEFCR